MGREDGKTVEGFVVGYALQAGSVRIDYEQLEISVASVIGSKDYTGSVRIEVCLPALFSLNSQLCDICEIHRFRHGVDHRLVQILGICIRGK